MAGVVDLLKNVELDSADKKVRESNIRKIFGEYIEQETPSIWVNSLYPFVATSPCQYWDPETVDTCLKVLENSRDRTLSSVSAWESQISIAFSNLFQGTALDSIDGCLEQRKPKDILKISTVVQPEYLRLVEHTYGNLLCMYWGILRKGGVKANFSLKSVSPFFEKINPTLLHGFNDRIRNGIAHGEIHYRGDSIIYGEIGTDGEYKIDSPQLLDNYDELRRTSNALAIGILLFGCRNANGLKNHNWPSGIVECLIKNFFLRDNFRIDGLLESSSPLVGTQVNIGFSTKLKKREIVLIDALRATYHIHEVNKKHYDRIVFDIDVGDAVSSLLAFDFKKLREYFSANAPIDEISDAIESNLLWSDEHSWRSRFKVFKYLLKSNFILQMKEAKKQIKSVLCGNSLEYEIRDIEKQLAGDKYRINIKVVPNKRKGIKKEEVKSLVYDLIKFYQHKLISVDKRAPFEKKRLMPGRPAYIWVTLYKRNGPLRWLGSRGWHSGNILCIAEWVNKKEYPPIMVKEPEELEHNIRYRFQIDQQAYNEAVEAVGNLLEDLKGKRAEKATSN